MSMPKSQFRAQFSLADLLAVNGPTPKGFSLVVLKSYFDGGNQADSARYDIVSLAIMSGTKDLWAPFEREWRRVLEKHHATYLHTTDAVALQGVYDGWSESARDSFLQDCVEAASRHSARPNIGDIPGKYGLFYLVVSFVLPDFVEFAARHPESPNNVNEACLRQALADVLPYSVEQAVCDQCHFFFDQGEPFYGHLRQLLQSKKALKEASALRRITHYSESNMRVVPALQLADLYAWGLCHRNMAHKPNWLESLLKTWFLGYQIDNTNLHMRDLHSQAIWSSWELPKRKPTR